MAKSVRDVTIRGLHPVSLSAELFDETVEELYGPDLDGRDLENARQQVRAQFDGLYLLEVQLEPPDASIDWGGFTQPLADQTESNWQVPYDERTVDEARGRWVFFLHYVDPARPLHTPVGPRPLPAPTPRPRHLEDVEYEAP